MILVDALYINYGGALCLLRYLVEELQNKKVDFFLLADARCGKEFETLPYVEHLDASILKRKCFYKRHKNVFSSVLCFGNVPPPLNISVPVYTYFHNINMLTLADCRDWKQFVKFWLKRTYIKFYRNHTAEWLVQTSNTAKELVMHLGVAKDKVAVYPFYKLPVFPEFSGVRTDYIFVGEFSGSKGHRELLEAWKILHKRGISKKLHLTVSMGDEFLEEMAKAINEGVSIENHGFLPTEELASLYIQCKATIYPSYNESFGLGLVEALEAGCDVIASDLPFTYAICKPSIVFNPRSPESIADAVIKYESMTCPKSELHVSDMVSEMIDLLTDAK